MNSDKHEDDGKTTTIRLKKPLKNEIKVLCSLYGFSMTAKAHDLFTQWKIETLKQLKVDAPEMYERYISELKKLGD